MSTLLNAYVMYMSIVSVATIVIVISVVSWIFGYFLISVNYRSSELREDILDPGHVLIGKLPIHVVVLLLIHVGFSS